MIMFRNHQKTSIPISSICTVIIIHITIINKIQGFNYRNITFFGSWGLLRMKMDLSADKILELSIIHVKV